MKTKENLFKIGVPVIALILVAAILAVIFTFRTGHEEKASTKVGVVLIGATDDKGWNESHYKGVEAACEQLSCTMVAKPNVPEQEKPVRKAIKDLIGEGCSCIFLTSFGYGQYADSIANENPDVAFYCISGAAEAKNCTSYFARMYQARYLSGIAAGAATESGILGYVSSMEVPETVRNVDAYCMGARMANPNVKVLVEYTGSWDDKAREEAAVKSLADAGADVITFHEDKPYAIDLADQMGLFTTGYDYVSGNYSEKFLTASVFNWDALYTKVLGDCLSGRGDYSENYWLGLSDGVVSLYPYSSLVSEETKNLIDAETERIKTRQDVFSGEIRDNTGNLKCHEAESISDDELFNSIDWYVEGVEVHE